ncbi:Tribbles 2 [Chamberlinius hualienensis]
MNCHVRAQPTSCRRLNLNVEISRLKDGEVGSVMSEEEAEVDEEEEEENGQSSITMVVANDDETDLKAAVVAVDEGKESDDDGSVNANDNDVIIDTVPAPASVTSSSTVNAFDTQSARAGYLTPDVHLVSPPSFPKKNGGGSGSATATTNFPPCIVGRYILLDQLDDKPLYKCVNIDNELEYTCKIVNNAKETDLLSIHYRVDSHDRLNELVEVLVGERHSYLFFDKSYGDLHSYVRNRRRLKEAEAASLFKQVVEAVQHCHNNGIVLRDLKLRKFVFKDPQRTELKLETLDDAVCVDDDNDILDDKHGCPAYVSPEILTTNSGYSGKAADMWSMGVMLYAMLVGRYPFHDTEHSTLFNKIRGGHYVIPDSISSKAKCLIRCLLRHNPTERLAADDVLKHPWFNTTTAAAAHHHHHSNHHHTSSSNTSSRVLETQQTISRYQNSPTNNTSLMSSLTNSQSHGNASTGLLNKCGDQLVPDAMGNCCKRPTGWD